MAAGLVRQQAVWLHAPLLLPLFPRLAPTLFPVQELGLPLTAMADWTCIAATHQGQCGSTHTLKYPITWHLWACRRCGAPRWQGPGWQLEQRLAAALQAGAALSDSLLGPHGTDAPAAAAAEAAAAALARFRWEAAGAAAGGAVPPDARTSGRGGSDSDSSSDAEAYVAAATAGLPAFHSGDWFHSLAELASSMLAESREWGLPCASVRPLPLPMLSLPPTHRCIPF